MDENKMELLELENELREWEESLASDVASLNNLDQNDEFYNQDCDFYNDEIEHAQKMVDKLRKQVKSAQRSKLSEKGKGNGSN